MRLKIETKDEIIILEEGDKIEIIENKLQERYAEYFIPTIGFEEVITDSSDPDMWEVSGYLWVGSDTIEALEKYDSSLIITWNQIKDKFYREVDKIIKKYLDKIKAIYDISSIKFHVESIPYMPR